MMDEEKGDLRELGLAITLLAGISALLFKIVDYFNNNIIYLSASALLFIRFFVFILMCEILIILLFLLTKGYIVSAPGKRLEKLKKISNGLHKLVFSFPIFVLICSFLVVSYFFLTMNWRDNISDTLDILLFCILVIISISLSIYLLFDLKFDLKRVPLKKTKESFKKVINELICIFQSPDEQKKFYFGVFLTTILYFILLILLIFGLFLIPSFLLCGSHSIEIIHFSDSNTDIMSVAIEDTGLPSGRCYIILYRVNNSNENLFQSIDNITLQELVEKPSKYMTGKKKDGIYYLFINTSNLPPDNYLLNAEVKYNVIENFDLFEATKRDNKLFYLPPKNKTVTALNQTSVL